MLALVVLGGAIGGEGFAAAAPSDFIRTFEMRASANSAGRCDSPSGTCGGTSGAQTVPPGWTSTSASAGSSYSGTCCQGWTTPLIINANANISGNGVVSMSPAGRLTTFVASGGGSAFASGSGPSGFFQFVAGASASWSTEFEFDLRYASTYDLQSSSASIILSRKTSNGWATVGYRSWNGSFSNPNGTIAGGTYLLHVDAAVGATVSTATTQSKSLSFQAGIGIDVDLGLVNVNFDYRRQARTGLDEDGDGKVNGFQPDGFKNPVPAGYPAEIFIDPCADAFERRWYYNGAHIATGCSLTYEFPAEGTFMVTVKAVDTETGQVVAERTEPVVIDDILIVSLGDSVASGEGAPELDVPVSGWQNNQCHRSAAAGPAKAAKQIEDADPKTTVTFVHLACSGATIDTGLLGSYHGIIVGIPVPPQVDQMMTYTQGRTIDALLISIGANDIGFGDIVQMCFLLPECGHPTFGAAEAYATQKLAAVPAAYDRLAAALTARGVAPSKVYLTDYFDPMRDQSGALCDEKVLEEQTNLPLVGITEAEARWASESLLPRMNAAGASAAARHGWNRVSGAQTSFRTHGYCASAQARWITQLSGSLSSQGDINGTLHPNREGHAGGYAPMIAAALP